jgi:hypothetical protein
LVLLEEASTILHKLSKMSDKKRGISRLINYLFPKKISAVDSQTTPDVARHESETVQPATARPQDEEDSDAGSFKTQSSTSMYEQEPFSSYQDKITKLCKSIGLGSPSSQSRLKGGSFNRVVGLEFVRSDVPPCVIRIPRPYPKSGDPESKKAANQVSTLAFVRRQNLPTPEVLAYDITSNNVLESEYMIQTRAAGVPLEGVYATMSYEEKVSIVKQMVPLLVHMETIHFPTAGKVIAPSKIPTTSCLSKFSLDPPIVPGFTVGPPIHETIIPTSTGASLKTLILNQLQGWIDYHCAKLPAGREDEGRLWFIDLLEDLMDIAKQMEKMGLMNPKAEPNVLFHWDLQPRNILVDKQEGKDWQITAILDWDEVLAIPRMLSRKPPVWLYKFDIQDDSIQGNPDLMGAWEEGLGLDERRLKAHFDREIEKSLPGYGNDAYGAGTWVRRLWAFAQDEFGTAEDFTRCDKFLAEWKAFVSAAKAGVFIGSIITHA